MRGTEAFVLQGSHDPIVADGRDRLLREERYQKREREVREAVRRKYEPELAAASGSWHEVVLYWKMRRELRREMDALAPERGSYLRTS
jgi:hypothetical protein